MQSIQARFQTSLDRMLFLRAISQRWKHLLLPWKKEGLKISPEQIVAVDVLAFVMGVPEVALEHVPDLVLVAARDVEVLAQEVAKGAGELVQAAVRGVEVLALVAVLDAGGPAKEVAGAGVIQHVPVSVRKHVKGSVQLVVRVVVLPQM